MRKSTIFGIGIIGIFAAALAAVQPAEAGGRNCGVIAGLVGQLTQSREGAAIAGIICEATKRDRRPYHHYHAAPTHHGYRHRGRPRGYYGSPRRVYRGDRVTRYLHHKRRDRAYRPRCYNVDRIRNVRGGMVFYRQRVCR